MKVATIITEIDHEDLVNLFSTAIYGSNFFDIGYDEKDYYGTELESRNDCIEDKCAKLLLAGKAIFVFDAYAEDEDEFYGKFNHEWINGDDGIGMKYTINLENIKDGIQKCLEGENNWLRDCAKHLMYEPYALDLPEAEAILQKIVFGELIYG